MSLILSTATRYLLPLLLLFSLFLLLRGHNEPGGGFVGGLVAVAAFALYALAAGTQEARSLLRVDTRTLMAVGPGRGRGQRRAGSGGRLPLPHRLLG